MHSFELSKLQGISGPRSLAESDRAQLPVKSDTAAPSGGSSRAAAEGIRVETTLSVDAGQPPVDGDRVAEIRKALQDGSYPLIPTEIADAMIAAQLNVGEA